jgi:hypothetical protein
MHAILALAGSHIALQIENPNTKATLSHRHKAIIGLEEAFVRWPPQAEEAHIMLATSYLLCFQSSYIEDGFMEHILSLRGCALLSQLILSNGMKGPFAVQANMHTALMELKLTNFPPLDQELACEALQSIKGFKHLLTKAQPIEKAVVASLVETICPLLFSDLPSNPDTTAIPDFTDTTTMFQTCTLSSIKSGNRSHIQNPVLSADLNIVFDNINWETLTTPTSPTPDPLRSFNALMYSLLILANWPHDELLHLFDPTNQLGNLIMAHFLTIRFIISPLSAPKTVMRMPVKGMVKWTEMVLDAVEDDEEVEWTKYTGWLVKIVRCMKACVEWKRGLTIGDVYEMLIHDPGAFKEGRARRWNNE